MRDARHARRIVRRLWPRFGGALLTVCAAAILELDEMVRRERDRSTGLEAALAERRRAEESLRALFDRNLAGMFRSRRDGRVLECNAAFVRLLGYRSREEVLACNAKEFYLDAKDRERLLRLLRPGAVVTNEELQLRRADGIPLWGLVHLREVADGPSTYLEGIIIDITDRKIAELAGRIELHEAGRP